MSWSDTTLKTIQHLNRALDDVRARFSDRDLVVDLLGLGVVAREHVLLIGPPGTGKTELIARFAALCDARSFQYLLTRFTEPAELFGPMDISAFRDGRYEVRTEKMLPAAEIAFLDEVFQGSSAILNTLLALVNERVFHAGSQAMRVPLISMLAASNAMPDDPTLRAFSDRFLLRAQVAPVPDDKLGSLLDLGWEMEADRVGGERPRLSPFLHAADLTALSAQLPRVKLGGVRSSYEELLRQARGEGVTLSDRRAVKGLKLVAAAAMLAGREEAVVADLWPLRHIWGDPSEAEVLARVIDGTLAEAGPREAAPRRALSGLVEALERLEEEEPELQGDVAIGHHLRALKRLRQELRADHGDRQELRERIDQLLERVLARLEAADV